MTHVYSASTTSSAAVPAGTRIDANINCPANTIATGGGGDVSAANGLDSSKIELVQTRPNALGGGTTPTGWQTDAVNNAQLVGTMTVSAYVVCTG